MFNRLGQDDKSKFDGEGPNFSSWTGDEMGLINPGSQDDTDMKLVNKYINVQGTGDDAHAIIARKVATEGTVLLKNEAAILPLSKDGWPPSENHESNLRVGMFGEDSGQGDGPNACPDRGCNQGTCTQLWAFSSPHLALFRSLPNVSGSLRHWDTCFSPTPIPLTIRQC